MYSDYLNCCVCLLVLFVAYISTNITYTVMVPVGYAIPWHTQVLHLAPESTHNWKLLLLGQERTLYISSEYVSKHYGEGNVVSIEALAELMLSGFTAILPSCHLETNWTERFQRTSSVAVTLRNLRNRKSHNRHSNQSWICWTVGTFAWTVSLYFHSTTFTCLHVEFCCLYVCVCVS